MLDKVLDTSKYVVENSKHVSIDYSNLIEELSNKNNILLTYAYAYVFLCS